jgi:hypothetical protein
MITMYFLYKKRIAHSSIKKGLQIDIRRTMQICDKNPCRHPHSDSSVGGTSAGMAGIHQWTWRGISPCLRLAGSSPERESFAWTDRFYAVSDRRGGSGRSVKTFRNWFPTEEIPLGSLPNYSKSLHFRSSSFPFATWLPRPPGFRGLG